MIKVAYDVTSLAQSPFGGIARVCYHTLDQAGKHPDINPVAYYRRGETGNITIPEVKLLKPSMLGRFTSGEFDIVHSLCHRLLPIKGTRLVYTLYDAWSLYPNKYQAPDFQKKIGKRMRGELRKVDAIVSISDATHQRFLELDLVDKTKCSVVHPAVSPPPQCPDSPDNDRLTRWIEKPFVLFVGRLEYRKNLKHVVEAVKSLSHLNLIVVGEPGYGYEDDVRPHLELFPQDRLLNIRHVTVGDMELLYNRALATLLPSWEEGFGLPILEAMARGCPVITANCSASAEVAGEGGILVDPSEPGQSQSALQHLHDDQSFRDAMQGAALKRAAQFSWEGYFAKLVAVYGALL